ncbi:MAG TPA: ABC transporter substrate-binding protein [Pirellulales bacterium]|nr:ABC transporter substrate-binding protein [Pirellulales bacterium]
MPPQHALTLTLSRRKRVLRHAFRFFRSERGLAVCAAILALAASGCGSDKVQPAKPADGKPAAVQVRLFLNWYPEAEHGGYYAALVHGFYRDAGLDVELVKGGPSAPVVQQVAGGRIEFGISNADGLLLARAEEAQVVALMAPLQTSPRCIMVHESSGITDFAGLKNMTLAMNALPFASFLEKHAMLTNVTIVPYQGSVAQFLSDDKFGQQAYVFSEPFVARQKGGDPKTLLVADLGFNPYTSVLFTSESYLREHEDVASSMVAASVKGWTHYLEQPDETNRHIHEINPEMSLEALEYGVKALEPLAVDDTTREHGIGSMSIERWQTLTRQLEELELIKPGAVDAAAVMHRASAGETESPKH